MWNTANSGHEEYNEEHICEIVANCIDFINEVIQRYKNTVKINIKCNLDDNYGTALESLRRMGAREIETNKNEEEIKNEKKSMDQ